MKIISIKKKPTKKMDFSKRLVVWVLVGGFIVLEQCLFLIWYAIYKEFDATAGYLTAAVGVSDAIIGAVLSKFLSLVQSDHREGGITYDAAKAAGFVKNQYYKSKINDAAAYDTTESSSSESSDEVPI